jgi:epoxyqueuosine reductase QueG
MKSLMETFIKDYVKKYKSQRRILTEWRAPLVGFADARNLLFNRLKIVVGATHVLPSDLLSDAKTVIAYFIPFSKEIASSNTNEGRASEKWATAYLETNQMIFKLNESISNMLEQRGYRSTSTAPTHDFDQSKLMSRWSHKHVAFISGIGKFGIHNMIITKRGCCGRLGSIVTNAAIEPSRMDESLESCLYRIDRSCGLCVSKCACGALRIDGFDKHKCYKQCMENASVYSEIGLADVCGKCASGVPCSFSDPSERHINKQSEKTNLESWSKNG